MSEDVSSTIRVGVTVILVAALVATVLNLMVISQSILSGGQSTLQSGVDQVGLQEFETYNQKKISGTIVKSALALYEGRDIAIIVRTAAAVNSTGGAPWGFNYGCVLDGKSTKGTDASTGIIYNVTTAVEKKAGDSFYTCNLLMENGILPSNNNTKGTQTKGHIQFILDSARFQSELVKDNTGAVVGMMFTQLQ